MWKTASQLADIFISCVKHTVDLLAFYWKHMRNFSFRECGPAGMDGRSARLHEVWWSVLSPTMARHSWSDQDETSPTAAPRLGVPQHSPSARATTPTMRH